MFTSHLNFSQAYQSPKSTLAVGLCELGIAPAASSSPFLSTVQGIPVTANAQSIVHTKAQNADDQMNTQWGGQELSPTFSGCLKSTSVSSKE